MKKMVGFGDYMLRLNPEGYPVSDTHLTLPTMSCV